MTGNLARGTGCSGTTSVDFGLYSQDAGRRELRLRGPAPGRLPSAPWLCGPCGAWATPPTTATATSAARRRASEHPECTWTAAGQGPAARRRAGSGSMSGDKRRNQPVSRILSASLAALRTESGDDHSSRPAITRGLQRPTRRLGRAVLHSPSSSPSRPCGRDAELRRTVRPCGRTRHPIWSCSVRGFACHRRYRRRGALLPHLFTLTLRLARLRRRSREGGMFSVPLSVRVALPGRYPAHCPPEFGLSSRLRPFGLRRGRPARLAVSRRRGAKTSGRLAGCDTFHSITDN